MNFMGAFQSNRLENPASGHQKPLLPRFTHIIHIFQLNNYSRKRSLQPHLQLLQPMAIDPLIRSSLSCFPIPPQMQEQPEQGIFRANLPAAAA